MLTILPDFSMYTFYTRMVGARAEALNKDENMKITPEQIIAKAAQCNARLLVFSNPCNPTAVIMSREDILKVVGAVDAMVVVDEAYMEFTEGSVLNEIENYENLIVLKTCSKAFGMAAIRLGFAAANPRITNILKTLKAPYNVNSMTQAAGCVILSHREYLENCTARIKESVRSLYQEMKTLAEKKKDIQRLYPTATNFLYIKTERSGEIFEALKQEGISIRNMNGYLRISAGSIRLTSSTSRSMGAMVKGTKPSIPVGSSTHSTRFSMRTPCSPSKYSPGSSEMTMPGWKGRVFCWP